MVVSCGPSRHAIYLEMRYPSKSGLDLAGKVISVVYMENDDDQGNLFNESMADAFVPRAIAIVLMPARLSVRVSRVLFE